MTREKLAAELEAVRRESTVVTICVWIVAIGVMIYGLGNVYSLLVEHSVPSGIAWLLSPMVDAGLCVGLVGTRGLTRYGVPAGWVGALRWITALMTLGLNTATPIVKKDVLGVFIHSVGPVLLFVIVEAAAAYQYKIGKVIGDKQNDLDAEDAKRAETRAHREDLTARLRAAEAEVSAARAETQTTAQQRDAETLRADRAEADNSSLRDHYEKALRDQKDRAAEKLAKARAEADLPRIGGGQRRGHRGSAGDAGKTSGRITLTDEEAVQRLLATDGGWERQWSQKAIVDELSVGYGRAPRLLEAVTEAQRRRRPETDGGDAAVNE